MHISKVRIITILFHETVFTALQGGFEWEMPAQRSGLDPCSDKFGLPAARLSPQISKILSGQKWRFSDIFGIKHLWELSGVLLLL